MDPVTILYEDNHLLVAVKPVFMLSQADRSGKPDLLGYLSAMLKTRDNKPGNVFLGLVHRLDQPVGGVMIFAKTSKAAKRLAEQFRAKTVQKHYLAVTHGALPDGTLHWQDYLSEKTTNGRYTVTDAAHGRAADLLIRRLAHADDNRLSLAHVRLLTGRSHQIRLQCQSRGWPLVGDRRYGDETPLDLATPSIALFAHSLTVRHPVSKETLVFSAQPDTPIFRRFAPYLQADVLRQSMERLAEAAVEHNNRL